MKLFFALILIVISMSIQTRFGDYPLVPYLELLVVISLIVVSGYMLLSSLVYKEMYSLFSLLIVIYFIVILFSGIELNRWYKNSLLDNEGVSVVTGQVYTYIDPRPPSLGYEIFSDKKPCFLYRFNTEKSKYSGMHCVSEDLHLPKIGEYVEVQYSVLRNDIFRLLNK